MTASSLRALEEARVFMSLLLHIGQHTSSFIGPDAPVTETTPFMITRHLPSPEPRNERQQPPPYGSEAPNKLHGGVAG